MAAIEAHGLTKRYGAHTAVDGIDLMVPVGTCYGLLGPNGAGKTTTIKMIQAMSPVTSGSLRVLGHDVAQHRALKRRMGVVAQEDNLDPDFSVRKNLLVYARFFGLPAPEAARRADRLLEFVQLGHKADAEIETLSGGMKRRLMVARALMNDPDLLVLDEPTTGLDPQARHTVWDKVRSLRREGKTILLTTHYMDEAEQLCDRLAVMDHGRILEEGTPRDLIAKHTGAEALECVRGDGDATVLDALHRHLGEAGVRSERLPDRVVAFGDGLDDVQATVRERFAVDETRLRRATLEDVFLRLTGRAMRE